MRRLGEEKPEEELMGNHLTFISIIDCKEIIMRRAVKQKKAGETIKKKIEHKIISKKGRF
jgi:hypothetical protein